MAGRKAGAGSRPVRTPKASSASSPALILSADPDVLSVKIRRGSTPAAASSARASPKRAVRGADRLSTPHSPLRS